MPPTPRLELSLIDSSRDLPAQPPRRPSSRMSVIDRSWSEPHGAPVVAPAMLATGTAAHSVPDLEGAEAPQFLGIPVPPRAASRASAVATRADHDATSLVQPLPAPWRPGAHDRSAPRVAIPLNEHALRRRQWGAVRRRRRGMLLAGAAAVVALVCGAMALLLSEPDRRIAAPPQRPHQQPRAGISTATPPAARAIPAKPRHASTAAPKQIAVAPKPAVTTPKPMAAAAKPLAATPKLTAATAKPPVATPKLTAVTPKQMAAKSTVATPKQMMGSPKPAAASKRMAAKPTTASRQTSLAPKRTTAASSRTAAAPRPAVAAPKATKAKKPALAKPRS